MAWPALPFYIDWK